MGQRNITGIIALRVGEAYFPEREWNDFPVIILGWWLTELLQLWRGEPEAAEGVICAFMDGAFYYSVSAQGERWLIECVEGTLDEEIVAEAEVDRAGFMKEMLACAAQLLNACHARNWRTADTDKLAALVARVETAIVMQAA